MFAGKIFRSLKRIFKLASKSGLKFKTLFNSHSKGLTNIIK